MIVNFFAHQPALNYGFYKKTQDWQQDPDDPGPKATLAEMENVMRFWIGMGCDGFRVDMAGSLVKNDEDSKGNIALWRKVRAFLDAEFPEAVLVSEWGEPDKSCRAASIWTFYFILDRLIITICSAARSLSSPEEVKAMWQPSWRNTRKIMKRHSARV